MLFCCSSTIVILVITMASVYIRKMLEMAFFVVNDSHKHKMKNLHQDERVIVYLYHSSKYKLINSTIQLPIELLKSQILHLV